MLTPARRDALAGLATARRRRRHRDAKSWSRATGRHCPDMRATGRVPVASRPSFRHGGATGALLHGCGVHPQELPDIAVRVFYVAVEHEAEILRRVGIGAAAGRNAFLDYRIDRVL